MRPSTILVIVALGALLSPLVSFAATPEEEKKFTDAVQKAFDKRESADLKKLTCWDRVAEKQKKDMEKVFTSLTDEKDISSFSIKLADADVKFVDKDQTEDGQTFRANLKIIKQIEAKFAGKDKKTLGILTFGVGEKDGKLMFTAMAPVK